GPSPPEPRRTSTTFGASTHPRSARPSRKAASSGETSENVPSGASRPRRAIFGSCAAASLDVTTATTETRTTEARRTRSDAGTSGVWHILPRDHHALPRAPLLRRLRHAHGLAGRRAPGLRDHPGTRERDGDRSDGVPGPLGVG